MKYIHQLLEEVKLDNADKLDYCPVKVGGMNKVNILALGDVGSTVLMGLRLLGGETISEIGICDIDKSNCIRLEQEMNQIDYPFGEKRLPTIKTVSEGDLFDGDVLVFCASKRVPPIGEGGDVRMAQLDANREIIAHYGKLAKEKNYQGLIAIVSDPVDPLCKEMLKASGLRPSQIKGYGLGVMNTRAKYFAEKMGAVHYESQGRAFGPHGRDLVIADSISNYDDALSKEITEKTVNANVKLRELGFKPYMAPAISSAAISILLTMQGQWHYSSVYLGDSAGGAFLGIKNRLRKDGTEYEDLLVCDELYNRIKGAYLNLCEIK